MADCGSSKTYALVQKFVDSPSVPQVVFLTSILSGAIMLLQGIASNFHWLPHYIHEMATRTEVDIPPEYNFAFEGLFNDLMGVTLSSLDTYPRAAQIEWVSIGFCLFLAVVVFSIYNKSISMLNFCFVIAFSRIVDTLTFYIGSFDPFLMSFLILSANRNRSISLLGCTLSAFCHPMISIISTIGVVSIEGLILRQYAYSKIICSSVAVVLNYKGLGFVFPFAHSRLSFAQSYYRSILQNGIQWGLPTFISALLVPFLSIQLFRPRVDMTPLPNALLVSLWAAVTAIIACFLVLDHTRDACLLTIAPLIRFIYLSPQLKLNELVQKTSLHFLLLLFLARLVIPHITGLGPQLMHYQLIIHIISYLT